ncbi:MAG TPA: TrpB-like pyridoxal phosphate-dependent enzyme [Bacteroidales bacterium]|nr:TrpB-like pyridoxal phosphate-dependent enzyme [Bacteroidales bacterium]HPE58166.1 TrpB-like pyridoxal phosphate-dependent enzyme [Bacteroidales bacterium]HRX96409.1 TrpB-like pyridoxal phosphate-dependent enzyme [Bacteroidales bacterium]
MTKMRKVFLSEKEMPTQWYNIQADMPNACQPPLHPATRQPVGPDDLAPLFPMELIKQEVTRDRFVDIPEEVQDIYKIWRPSPLIRAINFEKALDAPVKIYYKNESVSPAGSHKPNTAVPQAYYNYKEGVKKLTTETGAGQWGSALSFACGFFGIELQVFMVKVSYNQKPYRKSMMNTWNANVVASPSTLTQAGRKILEMDPDSPGSLGIAISEAVEAAVTDPAAKYSLGSVLNHVLLHQTIIGLEALKQFDIADDYPDVVIGCFGGGSNFAGISFPFLKENLTNGKNSRIIAVEPESCPKLTRGKFMYDFGDTIGMTPLMPMYTLGHNFMPPKIHAGGLRYHGAGPIVSQLLKDKLIEASAVPQKECFDAGVKFARSEGIIPAPESTHAIAQVIREAEQAKREGKKKTILFNLSGHGLVDMAAYDQYFAGQLEDFSVTQEEIEESIAKLAVLTA